MRIGGSRVINNSCRFLLITGRKKTFARSQSVFEDRNRMLFLQTFPSDVTSDDEEGEGEREEIPPPTNTNKDGRGGGDSAYSRYLNEHSTKPEKITLPTYSSR